MTTKIKYILPALFSCLANVCLASTIIPLNGGSIAPGQSLKINLSQLAPNVAYSINCSINATAATKSNFIVTGSISSFQIIYAFLNGNSLAGNLAAGVNGAINAGENSFNVPNLTRMPFSPMDTLELEIKNLDDQVVENVHDCYADVAIS